MPFSFTVQILCIGTDRSQQTVQTKIRLLLKKQSDQGLHCLSFHQHLLDALMRCYIKLFYFLGQLWQLFRVSQILEFLRYDFIFSGGKLIGKRYLLYEQILLILERLCYPGRQTGSHKNVCLCNIDRKILSAPMASRLWETCTFHTCAPYISLYLEYWSVL